MLVDDHSGYVMKNEDIALLNISRLKKRHKKLAQAAEWVVSVGEFSYQEFREHFGASRNTTYDRIDNLKGKGFIFLDLGRDTTAGKVLRLVDCVEWCDGDTLDSKLLSECFVGHRTVGTGNLKFVEKASMNYPVISELWKMVLGIELGARV